MNRLPDNVLLKIFSYIDWRKRIIFESVSKRWKTILLDNKSLRYIRRVKLDTLVRINEIHLIPEVIQSLVKKGKLIDEIAVDTNDIAHFIQPVLQTIASVLPVSLSRLSMRLDGLYNVIASCNRMISLCNNLQVLELICEEVDLSSSSEDDDDDDVEDSLKRRMLSCAGSVSSLTPIVYDLMVPKPCNKEEEDDEEATDGDQELDHIPGVTMNLSGLLNLKQLTGHGVHFLNCRSPVLQALNYSRVCVAGCVEDKIDFVQMILSASQTIQMLHLSNIVISGGPDQPVVVCTMPKLTELNIVGTSPSGLTINLAESTCLHEFHYDNTECGTVNFDLSICRLTSLHVTPLGTDVVEQFVSSSMAHPDRLCLLVQLHMTFPTAQLLSDFFSCISDIYTYSFFELQVVSVSNGSPDPVALLTLVEHSPHLTSLNLLTRHTDMQCMIDIITLKVNIEDFIIFGFRGITNASDFDFLSCLYNSLSSIDPPIVKRKNKMYITYYIYYAHWTTEMIDLKRLLELQFNVVIHLV